MAFEIAVRGDVVVAGKNRGVALAENFFDLGQRPDIELALLAFRIGVERGREGAFRRRHLAHQPPHRLARARREQRLAGARMRERQELEELGVVVEHLLEMRHQPALVDRIAREAAAEVIVDAALRHAVEGELDNFGEPSLVGPRIGAPQHLQRGALREFGRAAKSAVDRIEYAGDRGGRGVELARADRHLVGRPRRLGEVFHQGAAIVLDARRIFAKLPRHLAQHVREGRAAEARRVREIGAAPDRLAGGRQEHGQRPAPLLAQMMQRRHVDLIDVRTLFAIDLDVDEQLVHDARGRVVLEALMRHHVAPVARRVADRQQDRLVGALGFGERLRAPRPPVDRIVLVLQQIRAGLGGQAIFARRGVGGRFHVNGLSGLPAVPPAA